MHGVIHVRVPETRREKGGNKRKIQINCIQITTKVERAPF